MGDMRISNNGMDALAVFFRELPKVNLKHLWHLWFREQYCASLTLADISRGLNSCTNLESLHVPLMVFPATTRSEMMAFAKTLATLPIKVIRLYPMFEDLENTPSKTPDLLQLIFAALSKSKPLQKLHIETVGSEP